MTVEELIRTLEKVQHKEAPVYIKSSEVVLNILTKAVIEHDLSNDQVVVMLKA